MRRTQLGVILLLATIMTVGLYTAVANEISGTHAIVGVGEVTCLKCHYGKYEEMVATGHGQDFVQAFGSIEATEEQPETYACLMCHGKRDRWDRFGMTDWVNWYENDVSNDYPGEWWSLGYEQIPFPFGPGFEGDSTTEGGESGTTSDINFYLETNSTGATITAIVTFFDLIGDNADTVLTLAEDGANANYTGTISSLYPDYFRVDLNATVAVEVTLGTITTDGRVLTFASDSLFRGVRLSESVGASQEKVIPIDPSVLTAQNLLPYYAGVRGYDYAGSYKWNFHTGDYAEVTRMTAVWEDIRTIDTQPFPAKGIPIDYGGTVGEGQSCASTRFLCHATETMIEMAQEGAIPNTMAAYGSASYYTHSMTLSTASVQICGTCHAVLFADGLTAHEGVQCYDCHAAHPMPAGSE
jgi:hypothetical protein